MCLFLSFFHLVASWNLNENLFRPRILFVLWHPLLPLIPLLLLFDSVMRRPVRTSWRTSLDEAFIQNAKSSYQIFPILTYPLSSTVGVGSHCLASTCPSVIIQVFYSNMHEFDYSIPQFVTRVRGIRIVVTPGLIFEVLHVPRVKQPDYPSCGRLRTVSKDELSSLFCETPSSWGDHQNTLCSGFAKGPRFLNMVMTFILYPLSHYNTITASCLVFAIPLRGHFH